MDNISANQSFLLPNYSGPGTLFEQVNLYNNEDKVLIVGGQDNNIYAYKLVNR